MTLYQFIFLVLLWVIIVYVQLRYAWANYPETLRWKLILFFSAFIGGGLSAVTIGYQALDLRSLLIFVTLGGLFFGLIFTFVFPSNMQGSYPKRKEPDGPDQQ